MGDTNKLTSLFGLVNMVAKVEKRGLTPAGKHKVMHYDVKKPTLYHLVLSLLYQMAEEDGYMKKVLQVCHKFLSIPDVPQGLIMFSVLSQKMFKTKILEKPIPDLTTGKVDWRSVGVLEAMPAWAVDKHTYRGKFGKSSAELFRKKIKPIKLTEAQIEEFHCERPKVGISTFFDVGCVCSNEILPNNPIWEPIKQMYFKQTPKNQKTAKMTQMYYDEARKVQRVILVPSDGREGELDSSGSDTEEDSKSRKQPKKRKVTDTSAAATKSKQRKLTDYAKPSLKSEPSTSKTKNDVTTPKQMVKPPDILHKGPLLQLPTGSGKVYTVLDSESNKVWKGPYKTKERLNLCKFFHKAMSEVFHDVHTMSFEEDGEYINFPLLKSKTAKVVVKHRAFYDCIGRRSVSVEDGMFVERDSLGLVQLHKLPLAVVESLPVTIWAHFAFRYVLNIGDSGLYNAIATDDMTQIYGIDMEENRKQVKGNDVINMMFTKLPRKEIVEVIKKLLITNIEGIYKLFETSCDFDKLSKLYKAYGVPDERKRCEERFRAFRKGLEIHGRLQIGV